MSREPAASLAASDPRVDTILAIVAREAKIERARLQLEARTDDLGIGSLDLTLAMFEIESHFGVELPAAEQPSTEPLTVGMLVAQVLQILDAKANNTESRA